ncbi:hypothetical protein FHG87_005917 [Trinorchestia longiramus]|nr:hypothetical protein FHG87_005917 [Trinorchestia longiramus]
MSLLDRKKKQWEEERAFLAGAGIGVWGVNTADTSSRPNRKEGSSKKPSAGVDAPREDALKLQLEQQRLALQIHKQETLEKQLKGQERQKQILHEQYQNQQSIRIDSKQIPLHNQNETNDHISSSPACGITIPDDYFKRRIPTQANSQPTISSSRPLRNKQESVPQRKSQTTTTPSQSDSVYDRSLPVPTPTQYSNANVYSMSAYQMQASQPHPQTQYPQQYPQPQYQYRPPLYMPQNSSTQPLYAQNPYHYQHPYQVPQQQYHSSVVPQSHPPIGSGGYGYGSTAGSMEGGVLSQSVTNATYLVPTSSGRADVLTVRGTPPADGVGWSQDHTGSRTVRPLDNRSRKSTDTGGSRAKWGDHGVGVGHLWDPSTDNKGRKDSLPPSWVEQHADNALPGAPLSQSEQKTHARGQGMAKLDPERAAERARKMKRAEETHRVIERQLAEKKRLKEEEEERERKEAKLWDERIKKQQEEDAREYQEELNRRRQKEEAEQRRQEQLQEALKKAEQRARQEKEEKKTKILSHAQAAGTSIPLDDPQDKTNTEEFSTKPVQSTSDASRRNKRPRTNTSAAPETSSGNSQPSLESFHANNVHHKNNTHSPSSKPNNVPPQVPQQSVAPQAQNASAYSPASAPPALSSNQLSSGVPLPTPDLVAARIKLLTALGLTPDYLVSTGLLDRNTLLSLLGVGYESKFPPAGSGPPSTTCIVGAGGAPAYISDRLLTPRKYRDYRECGTQCEVSSSRSRNEDADSTGTRPRRSKATAHRRGSANEDRPPWNRHRSDRPYRKQSEKDLASSRRLRRKQPNRSLSASGGDTEESDAVSGTDRPTRMSQPRPLRRTWDQSRQDSMSSDQSRSPSPSEDSNLQRSHSRSTPMIKSLITPVYKDQHRSRKSTHLLSRSLQSLQKARESLHSSPTSSPPRSPNISIRSGRRAVKTRTLQSTREESGNQSRSEDNTEDINNTAIARKNRSSISKPESFEERDTGVVDTKEEVSAAEAEADQDNRSDSPPVPALRKESENFDVPEYAPGEGPPSEPYKPALPPTARRKPKKPYIRQPKLTVKKKSENSKPSENDHTSKDPRSDLNSICPSVSETPSRQRSQIDLTLQYYEDNRSPSPPVPAVQKRLNSLNDGEEHTSELPELPSTNPGKTEPLKKTEEQTTPLPQLPETQTTSVKSTNSPVQQAETSPSRTSKDSFFSNPPTPRLSNSSSSSEVMGLSSSPSTPQRRNTPGRSTSAGSRPPTPRRLQPLLPSAADPLAHPTNLRNPGIDTLPGKGADRHQMTKIEVHGESRGRLETLLEGRGTTAMRAEIAVSALDLGSSNTLNSRRGSLTSTVEDDRPTTMSLSSGYESGRRSSDEPSTKSSKSRIEEPLVAPEKLEVLQSLSSLRQNLWRRQQDLEENRKETRTPDTFS